MAINNPATVSPINPRDVAIGYANFVVTADDGTKIQLGGTAFKAGTAAHVALAEMIKKERITPEQFMKMLSVNFVIFPKEGERAPLSFGGVSVDDLEEDQDETQLNLH